MYLYIFKQVKEESIVVCDDSIYIQYTASNVSYELMRATGDALPIVIVEQTQIDLIFDSCVHRSIMQRNGFLIDVSISGKLTSFRIYFVIQYFN